MSCLDGFTPSPFMFFYIIHNPVSFYFQFALQLEHIQHHPSYSAGYTTTPASQVLLFPCSPFSHPSQAAFSWHGVCGGSRGRCLSRPYHPVLFPHSQTLRGIPLFSEALASPTGLGSPWQPPSPGAMAAACLAPAQIQPWGLVPTCPTVAIWLRRGVVQSPPAPSPWAGKKGSYINQALFQVKMKWLEILLRKPTVRQKEESRGFTVLLVIGPEWCHGISKIIESFGLENTHKIVEFSH